MESSKLKDFWTGLFLFCFSLVLYFYLTPNFVTEGSSIGLSTRFFPSLAAIVLGSLSLLLMLYSLLHLKSSGHRLVRYENINISNALRPIVKARILLVLVILAVFFLLFEHFGFFAASPFAVSALMMAFGQRKWLLIVSISIGMTAVLYCLFTYGLRVPLS